MRYLSVCSGIEAATVAWHPLGWEPVAFSEIEAFPCAVLMHHYRHTPNWGDMVRFREWPDADVDVLVGGTPCQSFSVAGLRKGLADPRGNLAFTFLAIAERYRPRWLVWENVPGVLSADEGRALGAFLGGLAELGYGFAWRVLDAQYFGLAQRRKRVFIVGYLGDWRRAAAVLFESASLRGDPAPRREAGKGTAGKSLCSSDGGIDREDRHNLIAGTLQRGHGNIRADDATDGRLVTPTLTVAGKAAGSATQQDAENGMLIPVGPGGEDLSHAVSARDHRGPCSNLGQATLVARNDRVGPSDVVPPLKAQSGRTGKGDSAPCVAFDTTQITSKANRSNPKPGDPSHPLAAGAHPPAVAFADLADPVAANQARTYTREGSGNFRLSNVAHTGAMVRRLTPRECERLQGFPDYYTLIPYRGKPAKDGPRYKALGNSMAVPVMRWIGQRIAWVETLTERKERAA